MKAPKGFTLLELLLVIALFAVMAGMTSISLTGLVASSPLKGATITTVDTLRRAVTQAMSGHYGSGWGVHFSDTDGCSLPATSIWIFRGDAFSSATDTVDAIALPDGSNVSALSIAGGGCDVKFSRYHGAATTTGTVTLSNVNGATSTISINAYGKVEIQ